MSALPPKADMIDAGRSTHQNRNFCRDGAVSIWFAMTALPPKAGIHP